jgi:WD40 repeat protein
MTQVVPLARRLHRELEWIPLKAMRKDRCRRYKSASDMADDIQSYLNGNPLIAGPETAMYRVQKFVRRHAGSVATAALVSVAVVLGLVVSIMMGCRAERARQQEVSARRQVEAALVRAENAEKAAEEQRALAEERAGEYRRSLYVHSINLADVAHGDGDIGRMRKFLDSCPEDLRAWEWHRLNYISDQALMTIQADKEEVYGVALAPDGKRIVSAGADGMMRIWDAVDGRELMTLRGHQTAVMSVVFSADGTRIASVDRDNRIKLWNAQSGTELKTLTADNSLFSHPFPVWVPVPIAFSPDGKMIVSGSPNSAAIVWDADSGAELMTLTGHSEDLPLTGFAFTPDGKRMVSSSMDKTLRVWDMSTGRQLMVLKGHINFIGDVAISPDGTRIVSAGIDRVARVWDMSTGAQLTPLPGHDSGIRSVAFSGDGTRIVTGGGKGKIRVWDAATGTELTTLLGHLQRVNGVAFSPDGKRIVSGSADGTVKIWEPGVDPTAPVTLEGRCHNMAYSPDGKRILTSGPPDVAIRVWDATTHEEIMKLEGANARASFSPDGRRIISADGNDICVRDTSSGRRLMTLSGHESGPLSEQQGDIWSIAYSPDGTRIASGGLDRTVRVWDAATGAEIMTLRGHGEMPGYPECSPVSSVVFSPSGELIASGSYDFTVKIWNARTGAEIRTMKQASTVNDLLFSPDGTQIVVASHMSIRMYDVETGRELRVLQGHEGEVLSLALSPDGKRIVSGAKDDTVRIWDMATGQEVQRLPVQGWVWEVCFSPDGMTLATTSATRFWTNCTITLWETAGLKSGGQGERRESVKQVGR